MATKSQMQFFGTKNIPLEPLVEHGPPFGALFAIGDCSPLLFYDLAA